MDVYIFGASEARTRGTMGAVWARRDNTQAHTAQYSTDDMFGIHTSCSSTEGTASSTVAGSSGSCRSTLGRLRGAFPHPHKVLGPQGGGSNGLTGRIDCFNLQIGDVSSAKFLGFLASSSGCGLLLRGGGWKRGRCGLVHDACMHVAWSSGRQ